MSTHPYIPLYVDDFEAATAHLTPEEDGVYNRLLRLCWRTPGCSLPDDKAWIARKVRMSVEDFERAGLAVLTEFFTLSRGRWTQRRLKREYDDISRKKSARKQAGKKGGTAKALKEKDKPASNATGLLPDMRAFPEPYPEPESKKDKIEAPQTVEPSLNGAPAVPATPAQRGSRLTSDWCLGGIERGYAEGLGFTPAEVDRIAEDFRDYWVAQAGQKGVKLDWPATWRRWVRHQSERKPRPRQQQQADWC